jgi:hypothetical protein
MNYTIIGHTKDSSYYDRCGGVISQPGTLETQAFRDDKKAEFLRAWAHASFHNTYEDLLILINGIPIDQYEDDEYEPRALEIEMEALLLQVKAEHDEAERIRKEAAANAAAERARRNAAEQRARDLAQLEELQRRLGVK